VTLIVSLRHPQAESMRDRFLHALTTEVAKVLIILVILLSLAYLRDVSF
jgi:hypothetical protein